MKEEINFNDEETVVDDVDYEEILCSPTVSSSSSSNISSPVSETIVTPNAHASPIITDASDEEINEPPFKKLKIHHQQKQNKPMSSAEDKDVLAIFRDVPIHELVPHDTDNSMTLTMPIDDDHEYSGRYIYDEVENTHLAEINIFKIYARNTLSEEWKNIFNFTFRIPWRAYYISCNRYNDKTLAFMRY